jgi:hypothetical protein
MKTNTLQLPAAMAILLMTGGLAGITSAAAEENDAATTTKDADNDTAQHNRELAQEATDDATSEAVGRILENTKLELDIQLIGRSSKTVAATR